jgi:long-chain acyl-CoA synthetase
MLSLEAGTERYWLRQAGDPERFRDAAHSSDVAVLIYTSGTTGNPKAVQLTHGNLIANLESVNRSLDFGPSDVWCSVLPLHHTFEATCGFLAALDCGATVVYARSLKSRDIIEDISANRATVMCGVPLLFEKMYQSIQRGVQAAPLPRRLLFGVLFGLSGFGWALGQRWGRGLFRSLRARTGMVPMRLFVSGGAPLPPHIARFFNLIGFGFLQGYGLTECSPVVSVNRPHDIKFGSVGPPLDGVEVCIGEADAGGIGEILIRGGNVTPGYKDNPAKTAELFGAEGWLHTGDLGCLKNGHLWITGRAKNLIVSAAGKNIYPEELEEKLCASSLILEALVFGASREGRQGEEVRAVLVPDKEQFAAELGMSTDRPDMTLIGQKLTEVVSAVNAQVADYKRIAGFDVRLEELEKTSTKKVKRFLYQQGRVAPQPAAPAASSRLR